MKNFSCNINITAETLVPFFIVAGICFIIFIIAFTHNQRVLKMAELGYCEIVTPGNSTTIWGKCK